MKFLGCFCLFFVAIAAQASLVEDFDALAYKCAPNVSPDTLRAIVTTESSFNPLSIAVVGENRVKQPKTLQEAVLFVSNYVNEKRRVSVGLAQINSSNFKMLNMSAEELFDPCNNLKAASIILSKCYKRMKSDDVSKNLADAISCYYSGNAKTGYEQGYVDRVIANAKAEITVPSIKNLLNKNVSVSVAEEHLIKSNSNKQNKQSLLIF